MRWKITIEGMDEFGGRDGAEMVIEKEFSRLSKGEIGLSIADGKAIMARLQHGRADATGGDSADLHDFQIVGTRNAIRYVPAAFHDPLV